MAPEATALPREDQPKLFRAQGLWSRTQDPSLPAGQRLPQNGLARLQGLGRQGTRVREATSRVAGPGQDGRPDQLLWDDPEVRRKEAFCGQLHLQHPHGPCLVRLRGPAWDQKLKCKRAATGGGDCNGPKDAGANRASVNAVRGDHGHRGTSLNQGSSTKLCFKPKQKPAFKICNSILCSFQSQGSQNSSPLSTEGCPWPPHIQGRGGVSKEAPGRKRRRQNSPPGQDASQTAPHQGNT